MTGKLKILTVAGTRPEIIRLSRIIDAFERHTDHVLVHTGQNYDYELNEIFFEDLGMRRPDHFLNVDTSSLGAVLGDVLRGTERVLLQERPDAMVVLGDTNSCISALMARRLRIPVYHLEAGNRSFDPNVPEEINRHLVDHVADYNLVYTEHSRRNLLAEGLHASRILLTGSPMLEVLNHHSESIAKSDALHTLGLERNGYFLASLHREENVDSRGRLERALDSLADISSEFSRPVLLSTHPRTRQRIEEFRIADRSGLVLHRPLGFIDYVCLQKHATCVLSDSGTVSEESSMLGFPAVTLRVAIERPEALDAGAIVCAGIDSRDVLDAVKMTLAQYASVGQAHAPMEYAITDTSRRVLNFIRSTARSHNTRNGVRVE